MLGYSFRDRLPEIEVPTLIVWGRNDILIPVEDAYEFERLIGANARAVDLRRHRATSRCSSARRASTRCSPTFIAGTA